MRARADPATLHDAVEGRRIEALDRRGKYLIWPLEDEVHVVMHLRMTGNLLIIGEQQPPYTRVLLHLDLEARRSRSPTRAASARGVVLLGDDALEDYFGAARR